MTDQTLDKPAKDDFSEGMNYLSTLPSRIVTVYIPLLIIMLVLLFPSTGWASQR